MRKIFAIFLLVTASLQAQTSSVPLFLEADSIRTAKAAYGFKAKFFKVTDRLIFPDGTFMTTAGGAGVGEANTASNLSFFKLFKDKVGVDLRFKGIYPVSNKIAINDATDSLGIDVNQANLSIATSQLTGTISTAQIADNAVSNAKFRQSAGLSVVGRSANTTGDVADITGTDGQVLRVSGTVLGFGTVATAGIANGAVTYAKMQNVSATDRFLGRKTAGAGIVEELTGTEATARLDIFTSTLKGLAPSSGGGTTNFLRADGTWAAPPGGGDVIEVAITWPGDFSGNTMPRVTALFPWSSPIKLTDPATLPTGTGRGIAWSPNGEFLTVAHDVTPFVTIYQRSGTTFTRLTDPATLPTGWGFGTAWSPNGEFLTVAHDETPYITIYQRSGTTFTKLTNPATLPTGNSRGIAWSPNGEFLAIVHSVSPYITIYQRSGTTFTKLTDPATLPTGTGFGTAWSPNGEFLTVAHDVTPYITIYQRSGTTFTKLTDPATLPTGIGLGTAWSPNGEFLAIVHSVSPYITIYQRSGTTFTKLTDPATLPTGTGRGIAWSPNGEFLTVAHDVTPYITIYQRSGTTFTKLTNPATLPTGNSRGIAWSPNGEFLAIVHSVSPYITIYQTASNMPASGIMKIVGVRREGQ